MLGFRQIRRERKSGVHARSRPIEKIRQAALAGLALADKDFQRARELNPAMVPSQ